MLRKVVQWAELLDALSARACVLSEDGELLRVNRRWIQHASQHGLVSSGVGLNYLEICEATQGEDASYALAASTGLREVLTGTKEEFALIYPCHTPHELNWQRMRAVPIVYEGKRCALILHEDISAQTWGTQTLMVQAQALQSAERLGRLGTFQIQERHREEDTTFRPSPGLLNLLQRSAATNSLGEFIGAEDPQTWNARFAEEIAARGSFDSKIVVAFPSGKKQFAIHAHRIAMAGLPTVILGVIKELNEQPRELSIGHLSDPPASFEASLATWAYQGEERRFVLSAEARAALGISEKALLSTSRVLALVTIHHRQIVLRAVQAALRSGEPIDIEVQLQLGPRQMWAHITGHRSLGIGASLHGIVAMIDERRQVELALEESQRSLALLGRCHQAFVRTECEASLLQALCEAVVESEEYAAAWVADFGAGTACKAQAHVPEGALNSDVIAFHTPTALTAGKQRHRLRYVASLASMIPLDPAARILVERGLNSMVEVPLSDQQRFYGTLLVYCTTTRAVSERELQTLSELGSYMAEALGNARIRAERQAISNELARHRGLLEAAMQAAKLASAVVNVDTGELEADDGLAQLLGLVPRPTSMADILSGLTPASAEALTQVMKRRSRSFEIELQTHLSPRRWVRASTGPTTTDGASTKLTLVFQDITPVRLARIATARANANLEQRVAERTHELQAANHELEAFSYSVSHDLKTPLAAVEGFAQVLIDRLAGRLDDRERRYLNNIRGSVSEMFTLIDAIMNLSRLTTGEALQRRKVDLTAMCYAILDELAASEPRQRTKLHIQKAMTLMADPALLGVAMRNLLSNAWKYSSRKSETWIAVRLMENNDGPTRDVTVEIEDHGEGFEPTQVTRLFTPFQRLHKASEFAGTGIGLATVQRVANRHGGAVTAEGRPGAGATFRITLPQHCRVNLVAEEVDRIWV